MSDIDTRNETEDEIIARHRKEVKELVAKTTGMKKQATKGEKKKKKEIQKEIDQLEKELKQRHEVELSSLGSASKADDVEASPGDGDEEVVDDATALADELLAELALEEELQQGPEIKKSAENKQQQQQQSGPKRNRRKEKLAKRKEEQQKAYDEAANEALSLPDLRKIELENITLLCEKQKLVQHEIVADGHCLFASISDQLQLRHSIDRNVQQLRQEAAEYIASDPDTFVPFLFDEKTLSMRDIKEYCDELVNTPIWGGDMEILALSKVFDCPVSIMFSGRSTMIINEEGSNPELKLVYYKHSFGLGEHYSSLRDES